MPYVMCILIYNTYMYKHFFCARKDSGHGGDEVEQMCAMNSLHSFRFIKRYENE